MSHNDKIIWRGLLGKRATILLQNKYNVGLTEVDYHIKLNNKQPVKSYVPRYSWAVQEAVIEEIQKLRDVGFIEPSESPYAAPIVCA